MKNLSFKPAEWLQLILLLTFVGLLSLGQLERWQITSGLAIYGHDLVIGLSLLLNGRWWWQQFKLISSHYSIKKYGLETALLAWILLGWTLSIFNGYLLSSALLYAARLIVYLAFNWQLLPQTWSKLLPAQLKPQALQSVYWVVGLFLLYFGFLQYFFLPDLRFLGILGWDYTLYRLASVQLDPNITGALLVVTLLITLNLKFLKHSWKAALALLLTVAIALTYSRSTYVAFAGGMIAWAFLQRKDRWQLLLSLALVSLLAISLPILPRPGGEGVRLERVASAQARLTSTGDVFQEMTPIKWVFGRGIFRPVVIPVAEALIASQHAQQPDNIFVLLLVGLGIGGSGLLAATVIKHFSLIKQLTPVVIASAVAVGLHSQFNNTLFQPFMWLIISGLALESWMRTHKN